MDVREVLADIDQQIYTFATECLAQQEEYKRKNKIIAGYLAMVEDLFDKRCQMMCSIGCKIMNNIDYLESNESFQKEITDDAKLMLVFNQEIDARLKCVSEIINGIVLEKQSSQECIKQLIKLVSNK